ncbi:MAG: hypothetical protein M3R64_04390 [Pseudomonadota bacterium]|nr:hypothetical protein [Pseudomonadota bacterium]
MSYKIITVAAAAFALVSAPTLASAAPAVPQNAASTLSLSPVARAATASTGKSHMTKRGAIIGGVLALGVIVGGIIAITNNNNNNGRPASR